MLYPGFNFRRKEITSCLFFRDYPLLINNLCTYKQNQVRYNQSTFPKDYMQHINLLVSRKRGFPLVKVEYCGKWNIRSSEPSTSYLILSNNPNIVYLSTNIHMKQSILRKQQQPCPSQSDVKTKSLTNCRAYSVYLLCLKICIYS